LSAGRSCEWQACATIDLVPLRDVRRLESDAVLAKPLDVDKLLEQLGPKNPH